MAEHLPSKDPRLSEIRKVTLFFRESPPTLYLIHRSEVDMFVQSSVRLHFDPGKNPHNGAVTARIYQITVASLERYGPYWWTRIDLGVGEHSPGAHVIDSYAGEPVWQDEEYVTAIEDAEDD